MVRITQFGHFLLMKTSYLTEDYAKLFLRKIIKLHGALVSIIYDQGTDFSLYFWNSFHRGLGAMVNLSTLFYPQIDGQEKKNDINFKGYAKVLSDQFWW